MRKRKLIAQVMWGATTFVVTPFAMYAQGPSPASLWQRDAMPKQSTVKESVKSGSIIERPLTVKVKNLKLVDAVRAIANAATLKVTYTDEFAKIGTRVSLDKESQTVEEAFTNVLRGTGFLARIIPPDEVVIAKRTKAEQDSAIIRVTVIDSATRQPIQNVMVEITGTNKRLLTDVRGVVTFTNVSAGEHRLRARRLGYSTGTRVITAEEGRTAEVAFALSAAASNLTEVVTTGSGDRAKLEVGTSIATVNADSIMQTTPVSTVSDLLASRIPGLSSLASSGAVGSPTRFRIRGNTSIEGVNEPLFILDGVRISNAVTTWQSNTIFAGVRGGSGENDFSQRLDDLDPNMIESIEILKGPTASTLYGSEAANGVIIIKTKRGQAGPTRWNLYADHRELIQSKDYEYAIQQIGYPLMGGASLTPTCPLSSLAIGACIPVDGEYIGFNMLKNKDFSPIGRGYTQSFGAGVSGGSSKLRFSLNATRVNQLGNSKLPNVNVRWIEAARGGVKLKEEVVRPNARNNTSASARIDGSLIGNSDFSLSTTFAQSYMRAGNQGMTAIAGEVRNPTDTTPVTTGWTDWNGTRSQDVKKINGSGIINLRPTWRGILFTGSATYGWDFNLNDDVWYIPRGSCMPLCTSTTDNGIKGYVNAGRRTDFVQTLRLIGGALTQARPWVKTDIRFGMDFSKTNYWWLYGNAADLRLGQKFYAANGTKNIQDIGDARATAGYFFEPTVNFRDRLFLTVGFRGDAGSALGDQVTPTYPKWNASWVLSDEPFFPQRLENIVDMVRVRFAYGQAGILPTSNARIRTYSASTGFVLENDTNGNANGSYAQLTGPGNLWVRPERSREYEGGFEIQLMDQRFGIDFTYFRKTTNDAIHGSPLAGSVGAGVTYSNKLNVGNVLNQGFELMGNIRVVENDKFSYNVTGHISQARNKLTRLDPGVLSHSALNASGDVYTGNATKIVEGYPLFGRWAYPILGYTDENGNGIIDPLEVRVGDSLRYVGAPTPKYSAALNHTFGFLRNLFLVNANFSYVNGMNQFNSNRKTNMSRLAPAQGMGSLADQACIVAATAAGQRQATDWCFFETTNTLRFENLGISYQLPQDLAKKIRAASARLSFNANNLYVWTNFKGVDPNVNSTPVNLNSAEAGSVFARPRELGLRLSLTF